MSYSQGDEEKYILQAVAAFTTDGRFLDIGAWHAKNLSNTRALFERGWSGVMVEPSPEPFLNLLREYGLNHQIQLVCGAVGVDHFITKFQASSDALTTSNEQNYERWKAVGGFYGSFYVPVITIPDIIERFGDDFDFVSIDAEGNSVDLFHALLATEIRSKCICVEYDSRADECIAAAAGKGYRLLYTSGENMVFAR
jgi:FkbM family methyltransferase